MASASISASAGARRINPASHRVDTRALGPGIEPFPLEFSGSGGEYFRVWIVNVLLSIVTLGLYTPFARRRTAQYFYGHTLVAGSPLEFTAQQRKMVVGFLVLVVLYFAFKLAADTGQDTVVTLFLLAGAALAPYFWASAMRFRLGATRWRGVRLQFAASWGEVYRASWPTFVIALAWICAVLLAGALDAPAAKAGANAAKAALPIPGVLAIGLGLLALAATFLCIIRLEFNYKSLLVSRAFIGNQRGRWKPVYGDFLRIWLATLGVLLLSALVFVLLVVVGALLVGGTAALLDQKNKLGMLATVLFIVLGVLALLVGLVLASAPARAYREARMFQLVWSNVGVSDIARFKCRLKARRYVMLRLKNMLLTLVTLGFWRPFALVSEYRMKTESVTLHVKGGLDQLVGQLVQQQGGIGDAMADAVGLDLVG
ncbi:MAG TPA: YjgN family protein [Ramlibacter sp.]|nr:YjgN family protein [Ramlibacter sp.]